MFLTFGGGGPGGGTKSAIAKTKENVVGWREEDGRLRRREG